MATFYIDSPSKGILELTSTTEIQITETSSVSKHKVETGATIADNIVVDNITASFTGVISEVRRLTQPSIQNTDTPANVYGSTVKGYLEDLRAIKNSKEIFTVRYDHRFPSISNCVLTSLNISRNAETGLGYSIVLSFEQMRISGRARTSVERQVQKNPDTTQEETKSGTNSQEGLNVVNTGELFIKKGDIAVYTAGKRQEGAIFQDISEVSGEP